MKPSKIKVIKAKKAFMLPSNFRALTWKGTVYCNLDKDVALLNRTDKIDNTLKCHETIHVRQAESKHDSWFLFYFTYVLNWIINLPLIFKGVYMPYKFINTELEAYANEDYYTYCDNGPVYQWKDFKKLTLRDKWKLAEQYKKSETSFKRFIKSIIVPYIISKNERSK